MLLWHVSSPFAIPHANLRMLGHFTHSSGNVALMNTMCDTTQFVIVAPVSNERASRLAEYFMRHVLLKFGIFHLVILDLVAY